jgi:(p)ppGpp synthase/HD superfamily hydrolase
MPMNTIDFAIELAAKAHRNQVRKHTDIPYITHPISVGMALQQHGYPEELIIAGILHDTIEDTPIDIEYIKEHFGDRAASIVEGCSEPDKSLPWEKRKEHTIEHLKTASFEVKIVSCADKLHNIRTIARDLERLGDEVWDRFNRGKEDQKWYYRNLVESFCHQPFSIQDEDLFREFRGEVENLFGKK